MLLSSEMRGVPGSRNAGDLSIIEFYRNGSTLCLICVLASLRRKVEIRAQEHPLAFGVAKPRRIEA